VVVIERVNMVSVIVPYLDARIAWRCLNSLPDTVEPIFLEDDYHYGPAVLRNRGAKQANGDILFFIDSDATVYPDTIRRIEQHFTDPTVDGVTIVWDKVPLEPNFFNKFKAIEMNYTMNRYFKTACASNGTAIRRSVFLKTGGFNEKYIDACVEDFEFGLRVIGKYNIVFDKTIKMQHSFCNSTIKGLKKYATRAFQRSKLLAGKNIQTSYNCNLIKIHYVSVLCPPIFILMNLKVYKEFWKGGKRFFIKASLLYYFYVLMVLICGVAGYIYAQLRKIFF
jgi:cellulose synthase/poly-beta-1,6-N-acetylglucosamine synthase-like glycosyltransferase